jgi:excisionase family DNA binding protein
MNAEPIDSELIAAPDADREALSRIGALLSEFGTDLSASNRATLVSPSGEEIELPNSLAEVLRVAAQYLANDDAISIAPISKVLTTQQAADLLNVSRPYLIELLERGDLPFYKVGTHRRIRLSDLLAYRQLRDEHRRAGLRRLTQKSQRLGLYRTRVTS